MSYTLSYKANSPDFDFLGLRANDSLTAADILDNMEQFVESERFVRGDYVAENADVEQLPNICNGYQACALGSLWISAEVAHVRQRGVGMIWPALSRAERRPAFLAADGNEELSLAYRCLVQAVTADCHKRDITTPPTDWDGADSTLPDQGYLNPSFTDPLEAYFEGTYHEEPADRMAPIIKQARRYLVEHRDREAADAQQVAPAT